MDANGPAKSVARSSHGFVCRSDLPDEAIQLAAGSRRARGDRWEMDRGRSSTTSRRVDRACGASFVRCNSSWRLDGVDEASFWRCHRIGSENFLARLDAKA